MATKIVYKKLDKKNIGHFFGRDKSGILAHRKGKDGKEYGTFMGYLMGKYYNMIMPLEVKTNKEGKEYKVGENKAFTMSFFDDAEGFTHVTLYSKAAPKKKTSAPKRAYMQTNRKYENGRKRYGKANWNVRNDF